MAKQGMKREEIKNKKPASAPQNVPELQGKAKLSNQKANPIIANTNPPSQKVWHSPSFSMEREKNPSKAYSQIDTDLGRDNLENDLTDADLQDL